MLRRFLARFVRQDGLPPGVRVYAISDIHGCSDLLTQAFARIDADIAGAGASRRIHVFLGDYVDRGPMSAQTLDLLIERSRTHECVFVKGNHEALLIEFMRDPSSLQNWKQLGGFATLMSYGLEPSLNPDAEEQVALASALHRTMPSSHRRFLEELVACYTCGEFFFAHAGARPGISLDEQTDEDLMWIRDEFLRSDANFGKVVVHGHTPVREPEIHVNRINIDTGAYATGNLTLLTIEGQSLRFQTCSRKVA